MKKHWVYKLLCLVLLGSMLCLTACPGGQPPVTPPETPPGGDTPAPEGTVWGEGAAISGAGDSLATDAPVLTAATYDESGAQEVPAGNFLRVVPDRFGQGRVFRATGGGKVRITGQEKKTYDGQGSVLLLPTGLTVDNSTRITLKNLVIVGDVTITDCDGVTFENVQIVGDVTASGTGIVWNACRLSGARALTLSGSGHAVIHSYIGFTEVGVADNATATVLQNCRLEGQGTALAARAADGVYTYNTLLLGAGDTGIAMAAGSVNLLAGMNVIRGAQQSATLTGAKNSVLVRNSLISVTATDNHAVYICDNAMGGRLTAKNNDYILADGNTYPEDGKNHAALLENNDHDSGNTLLNVDARLEVGADENLLPQVDKDLFVGMERKTYVREADPNATRSVYAYMMENAAAGDVVLVPPGAYTTNREYGNFREQHSGTTVYAYGVYVEAPATADRNYGIAHLRVFYLTDFTLKGISIGYAQQTCGQAYVLEKLENGRVLVVTAAGMENEFLDSDGKLLNTLNLGIQRAGTFYAIGDFNAYGNAVEKRGDGTMILRLQDDAYETVRKGDILTCRISSGVYTTQVTECENVTFQDMTVYGYSGGFAFYESRNRTGVTYYRVLNTTKNGPVIDPDVYEAYDKLQNEHGVDLEISIDSENRYRGSLPHIGSVDATHTSNNAQGSQIISCLFENMCDDGTNQNSFPARLAGYTVNGEETTLIFKTQLSYNMYVQSTNKSGLKFDRKCIPHRAGDRVFVYTSGGQLVCDTKALAAAERLEDSTANHPDPALNGKPVERYAVTVRTDDVYFDVLEGYDQYLSSDSHELTQPKVIVDNRSLGSNGFLMDNMMVRNVRSRGLLIKGSDGTVQNCTFRNIAKVAVAIIYEPQWGESSVSENVTVEACLIDHTSYSPGTSSYKHVPVDIMGVGSDTVDDSYLLYQNISLIGNCFINRDLSQSPYAVYIQAAKNVVLKNNDFGSTQGEDCRAIWVNGVRGLELSGNRYPPSIMGQLDYYIEGDHYAEIFGDDVLSFIPDRP